MFNSFNSGLLIWGRSLSSSSRLIYGKQYHTVISSSIIIELKSPHKTKNTINSSSFLVERSYPNSYNIVFSSWQINHRDLIWKLSRRVPNKERSTIDWRSEMFFLFQAKRGEDRDRFVSNPRHFLTFSVFISSWKGRAFALHLWKQFPKAMLSKKIELKFDFKFWKVWVMMRKKSLRLLILV